MRVLQGRNVNDLYRLGMLTLAHEGQEQDSRAGRVRVMDTPVTSVYMRPTERVLLDPVRDANPFFHLMESLWMLAGRDDAAFLDRYVGDFGRRFGEQDGRIHGAYGHRWRHALGYDQLDVVVNKLRDNPDDRQAVIQMWDGSQYEEWRGGIDGKHAYGSDDLDGNWRDRPCNTHVYLRVRTHDEAGVRPHGVARPDLPRQTRVLDLTVLCRSNDIVWGAYGANAVHFSVLQEYLAGRIGVDVGTMYQVSNNYHGYLDVTSKMGDPLLIDGGWGNPEPYTAGGVAAMPIGNVWDQWDEDLRRFMKWHDGWLALEPKDDFGPDCEFTNDWFDEVAVPVAVANHMWKRGMRDRALEVASEVQATDWRAACVQWIERRIGK